MKGSMFLVFVKMTNLHNPMRFYWLLLNGVVLYLKSDLC